MVAFLFRGYLNGNEHFKQINYFFDLLGSKDYNVVFVITAIAFKSYAESLPLDDISKPRTAATAGA